MSTREDLLVALRGDSDDCYCGGPYCSGPEELVDKFAHELAEKIRNHMDDDNFGTVAAADLIDPEVT